MRISHVGLTVLDLDEAIKFYEGSFGFTLFHRVTRETPWISSIVGYRDAKLSFAHMKLDGSHLELIQYARPEPIAALETAVPWRIGMQHFCMGVENLDEVATRIEEHGGVRWSIDVATIPDGPNKGARCAYFRGPSGELIELFEAAR